jgi:hypothetical protein
MFRHGSGEWAGKHYFRENGVTIKGSKMGMFIKVKTVHSFIFNWSKRVLEILRCNVLAGENNLANQQVV